MPLVPQPVYSSWFKRTSWVHHQFAYLFKNPLWDNDVPKGASLCVYWWSALFSALLFRPFVYTLLGFGRLIKALHLGAVIRWTDSVVTKVLRISGGGQGAATLAGAMILLCASLVVFGIYGWIVSHAAVGAVAAPVLALFLMVVLIACGIYAGINEYNDDRCRVEVYSRFATVAAIVVAFIWFPMGARFSFIEVPWGIVCTFCGGIWWVIASVFGLLWSGVSWTAGWVWASLPIVGLVVAVAAVVGLLGRFAFKAGPAAEKPAEEEDETREGRIERLANVIWANDCDKPYRGNSRWYAKALLRMDGLLDRLLGMNPYEAAEDPILIAKLKEVYEAELAAQRRRDEHCKRTTEALARLMSPFVKAAKQVGIFCAYMWAVAKARKASSCPYQRFED